MNTANPIGSGASTFLHKAKRLINRKVRHRVREKYDESWMEKLLYHQ